MDEPAQNQPTPPTPLTYEETPVIEPIKETPAPTRAPPGEPPQHPKKLSWFRRFFRFIGNLILFSILFAVGVWLSSLLRQFLPTSIETTTAPTPQPTIAVAAPVATKSSEWKTYQVISSGTKQPVAGISFQLPPDVLAPVCDGASCVSQGTYLPGGTRLTVAARGASQGLGYIHGAIITDAAGRPFTTKDATISGSRALEYSGTFRGATVGGYTFTQMRGVMIEVSKILTLELNHFAPTGVTSDFAADNTVFDKILEMLVLPPVPTPTAVPTLAPTETPAETSSGS